MIGIPGDRRDEDQQQYGAIAATAFDELYVREDRNLRGRAAGRDGGERRRRGQGGPRVGHARTAQDREGPRRDDRRPDGPAASRTRATWSSCASTTRSVSTARRCPRRAVQPVRRRSPTRASSKSPRAEPDPRRSATTAPASAASVGDRPGIPADDPDDPENLDERDQDQDAPRWPSPWSDRRSSG